LQTHFGERSLRLEIVRRSDAQKRLQSPAPAGSLNALWAGSATSAASLKITSFARIPAKLSSS